MPNYVFTKVRVSHQSSGGQADHDFYDENKHIWVGPNIYHYYAAVSNSAGPFTKREYIAKLKESGRLWHPFYVNENLHHHSDAYRAPSILTLDGVWPHAISHKTRDDDFGVDDFADSTERNNAQTAYFFGPKDLILHEKYAAYHDEVWPWLEKRAHEIYQDPFLATHERRNSNKYFPIKIDLNTAEQQRKNIAREVALDDLLAIIKAKNWEGLYGHHCRDGAPPTPWSSKRGWVVGVNKPINVTKGDAATRVTTIRNPQWWTPQTDEDVYMSTGRIDPTAEVAFVRVGTEDEVPPIHYTFVGVRNNDITNEALILNNLSSVTIHPVSNNAGMSTITTTTPAATTNTVDTDGVTNITVPHDTTEVIMSATRNHNGARIIVIEGESDGNDHDIAYNSTPITESMKIYTGETNTFTVVCQAEDRTTKRVKIVKITHAAAPPPTEEEE